MGANMSSGGPETKPRPTFRGVADRKDHQEKKKKASKLQTFKKKLVRSRRQSRSYDYCKLLRDYTSNWTVEELSSLVDDYESSLILKELSAQADAARPQARTLKEDLALLFDRQICTDVKLIFKNACYPVHRAVVSVRCGYFRELLKHHPDPQSEVVVEIKTQGVTQHLFRSVLRYLYTGEFNRCDNPGTNDIVASLCQEFGTPNLLEHDLRYLLETGEFCDTRLVFSTDEEELDEQLEGASKKLELPCHRAILCARSPFFRSIFSRKIHVKRLEPILLDETVIPRQYARVLLHSLYLDVVDLSCIVRSCGSTSSLSEVQAMVTGKGRSTHYDDAMDIFLIGRFVDFASLSQGCEDLIVESLNVDTLNAILAWSSKPHGSEYVYRQALQYLNDEFASIACSGALSTLPEKYLMKCVQSDFLQACEVDILAAVLKWGEDRLIKRIEEREPNLLAHTAHSVSKKGVKKRDLNDTELRAILSGFMPYIRTEHIIPANHDLLMSCVKRGLVRTPPSHMMADEGSIKRHHVWIRSRSGVYKKPRLFLPFYDEFRNILKEQLAQLPGQGSRPVVQTCSNLSSIPDTLYMVSDTSPYNARLQQTPLMMMSQQSPYNEATSLGGMAMASRQSDEDLKNACYSMPDKEMLAALLHREAELLQTPAVQKASCNPSADKRAIRHLIQLCAVREMGLPDSTVHIFRGALAECSNKGRSQPLNRRHYRSRYSRPDCSSESSKVDRGQAIRSYTMSSGETKYRKEQTVLGTYPHTDSQRSERASPSVPGTVETGSGRTTLKSTRGSRSSPQSSADERCRGDASYSPVGAASLGAMSEPAQTIENGSGACGDLSELVPDIAMSTPSITTQNAEMARLSVNEEMDLDLVDGTRKTVSVYI